MTELSHDKDLFQSWCGDGEDGRWYWSTIVRAAQIFFIAN